jgi:hypothetical protein
VPGLPLTLRLVRDHRREALGIRRQIIAGHTPNRNAHLPRSRLLAAHADVPRSLVLAANAWRRRRRATVSPRLGVPRRFRSPTFCSDETPLTEKHLAACLPGQVATRSCSRITRQPEVRRRAVNLTRNAQTAGLNCRVMRSPSGNLRSGTRRDSGHPGQRAHSNPCMQTFGCRPNASLRYDRLVSSRQHAGPGATGPEVPEPSLA